MRSQGLLIKLVELTGNRLNRKGRVAYRITQAASMEASIDKRVHLIMADFPVLPRRP